MPVFRGSGVAIVTPFDEHHQVDFDAFGELIDYQLAGGTDAIVAAGTTGEASTLSDPEHLDVIAYAVERVAGRVPVIAGAGSNDTRHGVELSRQAAALGVDALLHVTPYYNKTTQEGVARHFEAIADAVPEVPIILYSVPSRTALPIAPATVARLAQRPNIVGIKDAHSDPGYTQAVRRLAGDDFEIYAGNDDYVVQSLALGGCGVISVLANFAPRESHEICARWFAGDVAGAAALQVKLSGLVAALFGEPNPIPVKAAHGLLGLPGGTVRLPLVEASPATVETLRTELDAAGIEVPA